MIDSRYPHESLEIDGKPVSFVWLRLALFVMLCAVVGIVAAVFLKELK